MRPIVSWKEAKYVLDARGGCGDVVFTILADGPGCLATPTRQEA